MRNQSFLGKALATSDGDGAASVTTLDTPPTAINHLAVATNQDSGIY